jgi:hypothetical protein
MRGYRSWSCRFVTSAESGCGSRLNTLRGLSQLNNQIRLCWSFHSDNMIELTASSFMDYCLVLLGSLLTYLVVATIVQYWRLRNISGPFFAAWTNLWLMRQMNSKETFEDVKKRLHQKYGPVQRYGPNRVMFSDPSAISTILGTSNIYPKVFARV